MIKKLLILVAVLSISKNCAAAQDFSVMRNATPATRVQMQTSMMKSKLKLDSDQAIRVQVINLKYAQKFEPILKTNADRHKRMTQATSLLKQKDNELKVVFTAAQFKQYEVFEAELKNRLKSRLAGFN